MIEKLIAAKAFTYGSRSLQIGEEFDATRQDARVLVAVGRAKRPEPKSEDKLKRPAKDSADDGDAAKQGRAYKRRDMVAEDDDADK